MKSKTTHFFKKMLTQEPSPNKLALAFSTGIFIAFSPFVGLHTAMVFGLSWLLSLNLAIVLAVSCMINNPWTMMPVYAVDYVVGHWFCVRLCGFETLQYNPSWMGWFNAVVHKYTGLADISLWSFIIGGNLLGILGAITMFPIMKHIFTLLLQRKESHNSIDNHEDSSAK